VPVELYAADVEAAAVRCARRNVSRVGGLVFEGDLFEPLPSALKGRVDVLLANVPYVPSDEVRLLPAEARLHEPLVTLDGGADGLGILRRVSAEAGSWLAPGGRVLVETSEDQSAIAVAIFEGDGLAARVISEPEYGATVVVGTRGGATLS
jgi:release factor glutamine methyltransferase